MKIDAAGIQIHYRIEGERGPWVVLSHSLACNLFMWDEQVQRLRKRCRVLRFDTRGHGQSGVTAGAYSLTQLADDLHQLLSALDVRDPHFVGLSMGGMIGMSYALEHPGALRSLVLCDTTSRVPPEARPVWNERIATVQANGMEPMVEPTLARWFTPPFLAQRNQVVERVAQMIRETPAPGYVGCCHAIAQLDLTQRLGEITCPVQIIVGEQDVGTPVAMSRVLHEAIAGSRLAIIPAASHLSNLEQPEAFGSVLEGFLREVQA